MQVRRLLHVRLTSKTTALLPTPISVKHAKFYYVYRCLGRAKPWPLAWYSATASVKSSLSSPSSYASVHCTSALLVEHGVLVEQPFDLHLKQPACRVRRRRTRAAVGHLEGVEGHLPDDNLGEVQR